MLKRLLKLFKRKTYLTPEETHNNKLNQISDHLYNIKNEFMSLLPIELREEFQKKSYIAGGCIYSLYHNEEPKDYDFLVYDSFPTEELKEFFIEKCGYHGNEIHGGTYNKLPLTVTDNAISLGKFQLILQWTGSPKDTVSEFDFKHNMFYWKSDKSIKTLSDFKYLKGNELIYNEQRARDIVGTIMRLPKFLKRGMNIKQKELAKMLLKLHSVGFYEKELKILNDKKSDRHFSS